MKVKTINAVITDKFLEAGVASERLNGLEQFLTENQNVAKALYNALKGNPDPNSENKISAIANKLFTFCKNKNTDYEAVYAVTDFLGKNMGYCGRIYAELSKTFIINPNNKKKFTISRKKD